MRTSSPARTPTAIRVIGRGGRIFDAVPVVFRPVARCRLLLAPDRLDLPRCASRPPIRPAARSAAALGYPGGGALTIVPAAVSGRYQATGLDIYDEDRVRREILELRAAIERGDSGGPLILENGTVGGVIFAESRTNETSGTPWPQRRVGGHPPGHRPDEPGRYRDLPALTVAPYTGPAPTHRCRTGHPPDARRDPSV